MVFKSFHILKCDISIQDDFLRQDYFLWKVDLCTLSPCLDLNTFPHVSHMWETPVMCCVSMWYCMFTNCPSLPQTLQILALPLDLPPLRFLLVSIMEAITSPFLNTPSSRLLSDAASFSSARKSS